MLATITASIVALNAATMVEALLRFSLPLAAAGLWWVGITAEREEDPDEVKQLREAERVRRDAVWAISWRRLLVAVGLMRPGKQRLSDAERERRINLMVIAADRLHAARPGSRQATRARQRLRKLARMASANDITTVRARVARTTRIAELVLPAADLPATGYYLPAPPLQAGNGHASRAGSPASDNGGAVSPEAGPRLVGEAAPFHPNPPESVSGNGAASVEQPQAGVSRDGGREAAEQVYRDSVRNGRPLSSRKVARIAGCSPATAWRAIRAVKQASVGASPDGAPPQDGASAETDTLVEV